MTIGNVITELRSERNISQKKLADAIGVSQSAIAQIEVNRNEATAATIRKLAAFFDVSADYLLGLEDDFGARTAPIAAPMGESYSSEERQLVEDFRSLNARSKKYLQDTLKILLGNSGSAQKKNG